MTDLPNGVDQFAMKEAIIWKMIEVAIGHDRVFLELPAAEKITKMTELYKQAYKEVILNPS